MKSDDIIENLGLVGPPNYALWFGLAAAGLFVFGVVAAWVHILHRKRRLPFQGFRQVPPHRSALADLEALRGLISPDRCREFVFEVSKVLRRYLEARFGLKAPTLSTEEFLWLAESDPALTLDRRVLLGEFLRHCDRVKFALAGMEVAAMEALLESAISFVKETKAEELAQPMAGV